MRIRSKDPPLCQWADSSHCRNIDQRKHCFGRIASVTSHSQHRGACIQLSFLHAFFEKLLFLFLYSTSAWFRLRLLSFTFPLFNLLSVMKGFKKWWRHPRVPIPTVVTEKALPPLPPDVPHPSALAAITDEGWTTVNLRPDIRLPPELWKIVFQHATDTYPSALTTHISSPRVSISQPIVANPDDERRLIRASMNIKRTISLVCRAWRTIGFEFLFHTIHVTTQRTIPSLWYALREDAHRRPGAQGPEVLTWWIRRIWVDDLGPLSWYILFSEQLPEYSVLELVRRCPRLVEFAGPGLDKPTGKLDSSPFQLALHAICNSAVAARSSETVIEDGYKRPGLALGVRIADADEINRFVSANPSLANGFSLLASLYLHSGGAPAEPALNATPVHLPSLRFLSVNGKRALKQALTITAPSLTSLQYTNTHTTDRLESLLTALGGGLVELELSNSTAFANGYLERTCPRLQVLHIASLDHFTSNSSDPYHSTLTTVGVEQLYLGDSITRAGMSMRIQRLQWAFPALQVLKETSWKGQAMRQRAAVSEGLAERKFCGYWMCLSSVVGRAGVKLLDWQGRVMADFHLPERLSREWDVVLEGMFLATMEGGRGNEERQ